jgi:hypothetical protein
MCRSQPFSSFKKFITPILLVYLQISGTLQARREIDLSIPVGVILPPPYLDTKPYHSAHDAVAYFSAVCYFKGNHE